MKSLYWKDNMYSLTVLFWTHILIFLKASVNVRRIWVLYFGVVKMEEKGKNTNLSNSIWSSVLLIKLNEQHLQVFTSFPPWTSLETYDKILLWDAKLTWKWERNWHSLLFLHQQRYKVLFQTSSFYSFFMPKSSFTHLLSGCISAACSAVLSDHAS